MSKLVGSPRKSLITSMVRIAALAFGWTAVSAGPAVATEPLVLEAKIPLGNVSGRIDHMAIDLGRKRLFVAELGNNSVGIVDLKSRRLVRNIDGLKEPQGVAYVPSMDTLYVANAGDGSVRLFTGPDHAPAGQID